MVLLLITYPRNQIRTKEKDERGKNKKTKRNEGTKRRTTGGGRGEKEQEEAEHLCKHGFISEIKISYMTYQFERKINRFSLAAFYELLMGLCDVYAVFFMQRKHFRDIAVIIFRVLCLGNFYTLCALLKCGAFPKPIFTFTS